jgi:tetratricopeptide (TPR) repeat protein
MAQKALETLEHINASRFKEARKAITAALEKRNDNSQYVALKALLLIRTGATDEGVELMRTLKAKNVDDAFVSQVIISCLHETGAFLEALDVIEAQFNLNPQRGTPREDKLLASYVHACSFSKLQQYCMRAFRESSNPQYYIWSLVANSQHVMTPAGLRLADLACKQLLKAGEEGKLSTAEHVIFFLDFLCALNQPQRVLDAVQRPWVVAAFRRDEERLRYQAGALLKLNEYGPAREVLERLLQVDGDEWTFLRALLQSRCASDNLPFMQVRLCALYEHLSSFYLFCSCLTTPLNRLPNLLWPCCYRLLLSQLLLQLPNLSKRLTTPMKPKVYIAVVLCWLRSTFTAVSSIVLIQHHLRI